MARLDAATTASAVWACQAERVATGCGGRVALDAMLVEEDIFPMPLVQRGMLGPANRGGEGGSRGTEAADRVEVNRATRAACAEGRTGRGGPCPYAGCPGGGGDALWRLPIGGGSAARWQLAGGRQKEARAGARVPGWRGTAGADRQQKEHQGTRSGSAEGIPPARGRGLGEEAARG
jgi:hypothetical protein